MTLLDAFPVPVTYQGVETRKCRVVVTEDRIIALAEVDGQVVTICYDGYLTWDHATRTATTESGDVVVGPSGGCRCGSSLAYLTPEQIMAMVPA